MDLIVGLILVVVMAFLPPIIYTIWIRNTEKFNRERWMTIFICFFWGASIAIIASLLLELLFGSLFLSIYDHDTVFLISVVVIAPFAEELTKPLVLGLKTVRKEIDELEDGLIYGAVAGLGFSATENLFYGVSFLSKGFIVFLVLIVLRSFGGCLLHASATAWTGYGYSKVLMKRTSFLRVIPYFLLAMLVHGFYNFVVSYEEIGVLVGLFAAFLFVGITIMLIRKKIRKLDLQNI